MICLTIIRQINF